MGCRFCQHCIRCFIRVEALSTNRKGWMINFGLFRWFILNLFFPILPFDPPENIRKPKVGSKPSGGSKRNIGKKKGYEIEHCGGSYSDCSRTQWLILFHICYVCYCFCFSLIINNSRINDVLSLKGSHKRCSIKKEIRKIFWKALMLEFFKLSSFIG